MHRQQRIEKMGEPDAVSLRDEAKELPVTVETPGASLFDHLDTGLIVAVQEPVVHPAGRRLMRELERVRPEPLDADDRDQYVRQDAPHGRLGAEILEAAHGVTFRGLRGQQIVWTSLHLRASWYGVRAVALRAIDSRICVTKNPLILCIWVSSAALAFVHRQPPNPLAWLGSSIRQGRRRNVVRQITSRRLICAGRGPWTQSGGVGLAHCAEWTAGAIVHRQPPAPSPNPRFGFRGEQPAGPPSRGIPPTR